MIDSRTITFDADGTLLNTTAADFWASLPGPVAIALAKEAPVVAYYNDSEPADEPQRDTWPSPTSNDFDVQEFRITP
jgi:FMN phosphatase YigB (HAD superfamily)